MLELFDSRGWLTEGSEFFPYLARVSPFTEACADVATHVVSMEDFFQTNFRWMDALRQRGVPVSAQGLYQVPEPRDYNCGAVGSNGFVFTPDGEIHKCGLEVDDTSKSIGHLETGIDAQSPNLERFEDYSPLDNEVCRECEYLPSCLGGCPRNQIERRTVQMKENCEFHEKYEADLLRFHTGRTVTYRSLTPRMGRRVLPIVR